MIGRGVIRQDDRVLAEGVRYSVSLSEEVIVPHSLQGAGPAIPGMGEIHGWLDLNDWQGWFDQMGQPIELVLEDDRVWECQLKDSDGNLSNRSGSGLREK